VCGLALSCWPSVGQLRAWDEVGEFCLCTSQPSNFPGHARVLFCYHLRSPPTSWHYLHRNFPLPEHRRKRNVHSGACIPVFCHLVSVVSAGENGTLNQILHQFQNVQPLNLLHQRTLSLLCNGVNNIPKYGRLSRMSCCRSRLWTVFELILRNPCIPTAVVDAETVRLCRWKTQM
jgi:hypothetical protein